MPHYRNAKTGEYVSKAYADQHPNITVKESDDSRWIAEVARNHLDVLADHLDQHPEEKDAVWPTRLAELVGWNDPSDDEPVAVEGHAGLGIGDG